MRKIILQGFILNKIIRSLYIPSVIISIPAIPASASLAQNADTGYAPINGLNMYYEIHSPRTTGGQSGIPLVLLHGGGSTIGTTFGKILPSLAKTRQIIAPELQGHGHTGDADRPLSFEQDADDVAAILNYLKIKKADFFGFSNGGNTALQIAIRHPDLVNKLIVGSAFFKKEGVYPEIWNSFNVNVTPEDMPAVLRNEYLKVAPKPGNLAFLVTKLMTRLLEFKDIQTKDIKSVKAPTLIIIADNDVTRPEHAVEMFRLLPHPKLAIIPGGHGEYIGEITAPSDNPGVTGYTVSLIESFLNKRLPGN